MTADFGHNDLSGVEANILASGVTNVHTVDLVSSIGNIDAIADI